MSPLYKIHFDQKTTKIRKLAHDYQCITEINSAKTVVLP